MFHKYLDYTDKKNKKRQTCVLPQTLSSAVIQNPVQQSYKVFVEGTCVMPTYMLAHKNMSSLLHSVDRREEKRSQSGFLFCFREALQILIKLVHLF